MNQDLVREIGRRCAEQKIATIDLDATVMESWKREAQTTKRAFPALPETVEEHYFRGDSVCWERGLLHWLRDEQRPEGPAGKITFAVRVRMTGSLKQHIQRIDGTLWKPYRQNSQSEAECVDVLNYWPEDDERPEGATPLRYVTIRVRFRQGGWFADVSEVKYFAVASNEWDWSAQKLLEWHREKAGSVEALHDVLKDELAGGVMPCGRFGANAAWFRLAGITHNVLTALKRIALPERWLRARPKRLRFQIFCSAGKLVEHRREIDRSCQVFCVTAVSGLWGCPR